MIESNRFIVCYSLLLWIIIIFIVGNTIAVSTSVGILLVACVLSRFHMYIYDNRALLSHDNLVPEDRRASTVSIMFTGVPFGTFVYWITIWLEICLYSIIVVSVIGFFTITSLEYGDTFLVFTYLFLLLQDITGFNV